MTAAQTPGRPEVPGREERVGLLATHVGPYWGEFGGRFVPEALIAALDEIDTAYHKALADPAFGDELARLHRTYTGRPSPLTEVPRFAAQVNGKWLAGDAQGAFNSSRKAKTFATWSAIVGAVFIVIWIAITIMGANSGTSTM